jgi:hypothetical protein
MKNEKAPRYEDVPGGGGVGSIYPDILNLINKLR